MTGVTTFTFNAVGLDKDGLIKSKEEMEAEQQQAQQAQAQQQGMDVAKSAMSGAGTALVKGGIEDPEATTDVVEGIQQSMNP